MAIIRIILGCICLTAVWFAAWPLDSGNFEPIWYATIFSVAVSSFASWLSLRRNKRSIVAPVMFAAPFVIPTLLSTPIDGIYSPFIFWAGCAVAAFILSLFCDLLVFRKIIENEENA